MAGTIVNNMVIHNQADATTGWTGGSPSQYTAFFRESNACLGDKISNTNANYYVTPNGSPRDMSTETVHGWTLFYAGQDTYANGANSIVLGDATPDRAAFPCAGSDEPRFHITPDGWGCIILSVPDKLDSEAINLAGTTANITDTAITAIGYYVVTNTTALGNVDNVFWDIIWSYDHTGYAVEITAGTSGSPATFGDLVTYDTSTADQRGLGVISEAATDVFINTAPIQIGDDGTGSSYFSASGQELVFADVKHLNNHKFAVVGNSTGTNEAYFTSFAFRNVHTTLTATLNFNGGNINTLSFDRFSVINCAVNMSSAADATGHTMKNGQFTDCGAIDMGAISDATNNRYSGCAAITHKGAKMNGSSISNYSGAADTSSLIYNETADPGGEMDDMSFTKHATTLHHAIEFGLSSPTTINLTGLTSTSYNASNGQNDSFFHIKRTTGTVTINLTGCSGNFSYKTAGATVVVNQTVTLTVNVEDEGRNPVQNAQTSIYLLNSPYTELMNEDTTALGVATESYGGSTPVDVVVKVRKSEDTDNPRYFPVSRIEEVGTNGLNVTVTLTENDILP